MIKIFALLLSFCSLSLSFVPQTPIRSAVRKRNTRAFFATPLDGLDEEQKQKEETLKRPQKPKITILSSAEEYIDFLSEDDRLCMVKFHASWCKSCQKVGMQYARIGKEIGDLVVMNEDGTEAVVSEGDIRLAEIEYGANIGLCKSLGVKRVPSVHFYSLGKKVDGFPCGPKKITMLLEKLSHYRSLSLPELSFEADMNQGLTLSDSVIETLCVDADNSKAAQCLAKFT